MWQLDYSRHYAKWHCDSPAHIQGMLRYNELLLAGVLPEDRDGRVLDLGCGMGFTLLFLHSQGYRHTEGIDIDASQIAACEAKGLPARRVESPIEFLKARPGTYSCVIAFDLIEHFEKPRQLDLVRAIRRGLLPRGRLVCTVPNANSVLAGRYRYIDYTHYDSFTEASLDFLLFNAGFSDVCISPIDCFGRPSHRRFWHKEYLRWWLLKCVRGVRRLQMIAELGWEEGGQVPLSLNLKAVASKS